MANTQTETENCVLEHKGFAFHVRSLAGLNEDLKTPMVCIGGAFQNVDSWKTTVEYFQPDRRVLLMDMPGMGESDGLPSNYGLDYLAECIDTCLDWAGVQSANLLGASYGSLATYRFAQLYPQRVQHMALMGVMSHFREGYLKQAVDHINRVESGAADFPTECIEFLVSETVRTKTRRGRAVAKIMRRRLEQMSAADIQKYVENTRRLVYHEPLDLTVPPKVPSLVFTGEHDQLTKPEWNREVAAAIPGATFTTVRDGDHLCHLEQFGTVSLLISQFYDDESLQSVEGCSPIEQF